MHVRTADGFHQRFLLASPSPGIVHHLSGLTLHALATLLKKHFTNTPWGFAPFDSHARESPWSVFQDGCYVTILSTTDRVSDRSQMDDKHHSTNLARSVPRRQFHALLHSLSKVLCNFPSRYFCAIAFWSYLALDGMYHPY